MVRMVTVVNERAAMSIHSMRPQLRARVMLLQLMPVSQPRHGHVVQCQHSFLFNAQLGNAAHVREASNRVLNLGTPHAGTPQRVGVCENRRHCLQKGFALRLQIDNVHPPDVAGVTRQAPHFKRRRGGMARFHCNGGRLEGWRGIFDRRIVECGSVHELEHLEKAAAHGLLHRCDCGGPRMRSHSFRPRLEHVDRTHLSWGMIVAQSDCAMLHPLVFLRRPLDADDLALAPVDNIQHCAKRRIASQWEVG